jgi:hypothetical protein
MLISENFGHVIIDIEDLEMSKLETIILENAIKKINSEINIFTAFIYFTYYLIIYYLSFLKFFFIKKIKIDKIIFNKDKDSVLIINNIRDIFLFDDAIYIKDNKIPYENIISFGTVDNFCCIELFATIYYINNNIDIRLTKNVTRLFFKNKNASSLCQDIKNNMYYHLKYNKVNTSICHYKIY